MDKKNNNINISLNDATTFISNTVANVYGVIGLIDKKHIFKPLDNILSSDELNRGVRVIKTKTSFKVSVYVLVSKEIRFGEVESEIQKQVMYNFEKKYSIKLEQVNVRIFSNDKKGK